MSLSEFFEALIAHLVAADSSDCDVLLVMYLLHTHQVRLRSGASLTDVRCAGLLGSLTKADVAEMVGNALGRQGRNREAYWLREYALRTPYEFHDELPASLRKRSEVLRRKAAEHPLVAELVPGEG